ncbi:MAG: mechanosensitive ion channel family protein [Pseudomonadota bacterium]
MEGEIEQFQDVYNLITAFIVNYSFQILGAIIILIIGLMIARRIGVFVEGLLVRHKVDITLSRFAGAGVKFLLVGIVAIIVLGKLGISVTPFVAAVGALSLGAGLALQGMLSNYSAGVSIVVTRPFVVGDTITVQGVAGIVHEVRLGCTILINEDGVYITIPNKHIVGEIIHNSFTDSIIETTLTLSYSTDPHFAVDLIKQVVCSIEGVSHKRAPQVGIQDFGNYGVTIGVRYWALTEILFQTRCKANAAIHKALLANNIVLPYPQQQVHLVQDTREESPGR